MRKKIIIELGENGIYIDILQEDGKLISDYIHNGTKEDLFKSLSELIEDKRA